MENKNLRNLAFLLCFFLTSCTNAVQNPGLTPAPLSTPESYPVSASAYIPAADYTTVAYPPPTSTPEETALWKDDQNGWGILYPSDWKSATPTQPGAIRYEGESGYFEWKGVFKGNSGDAIRACTLEFIQNPDGRYGANPTKEDTTTPTLSGNQIVSCVIQSKDQPGLFPQMHYVSINTLNGYAIIETGGDGSKEVHLTDASKETVTPTSLPLLPTSAPNQANQISFGNLNIKEWIIAPADTANGNAFFMGSTPHYAYTLPTNTSASHYETRVNQANSDLALLGYHIEAVCEKGCKNPTYRFLRGSDVLKDHLTGFGGFALSADQVNFVLGLWDDQNQNWLATKSGLEPYDLAQHHSQFPIYVGNHLISLNESWDIVVESDGQPIFRWPTTVLSFTPTVQNFFPFDGHWAVEVQGVFIVDGEIWNRQQFPAQEIFETHLIDGKLFFFFRRDNQVGIYYDGQTLPTDYTLIHHGGCCEYSKNNPEISTQGISFYAIKNGMWNYVEIQKENP